MKKNTLRLLRVICQVSAAGVSLAATVRADVTIEQRTLLDVASIISAHGGTTLNISGDKKREDTDTHCDGVMSIVCGNLRGGDIVRLDRDVTWHLEPAKKRYREEAFTSPAELATMRAKLQAHMEKMQACPVSKKQEPVDKSQCEMSPPKIDVHKTDDKATIAGHEAQRTLATLTETCTNKNTGDVCDTVVAVDLWLTQEKVPGISDRHAFDQAYAKKLGLNDNAGLLQGQMAKYLAPYQSQINQLTNKSNELKGLPLKTSLRIVIGGPQCGVTKNSNASSDAPAAGTNPLDNMTQAGKVVGNLVGGLFRKKKTSDPDPAGTDNTSSASATSASATSASTTSATGSAAAVPAYPDPYAKYQKLASFTLETLNINTEPVAAERFEVPPDWKKEEQKPANFRDDDQECPKT